MCLCACAIWYDVSVLCGCLCALLQNGVGLQGLSYSQGVLVDPTPPSCTIIDGTRGQADVDGASSGIATVYVTCTDLESGVPTVLWGLGSAPGLDDVVPLQSIALSGLTVPVAVDMASPVPTSHKSAFRMVDAAAAATSATLVPGVVYYGVAVATNGAGLTTAVVTDGQHHDTSPPNVLYMRDVVTASGELDVQVSDSLTAWGASFDVVDAETGVISVSVQLVADTSGSGEVVLATQTPAVGDTRVFVDPLPAPLVPGQRVFTRITATNAVGQTSSTDSDGFIPDNTAPVFTTAPTDGAVAGVDINAQSGASQLQACWEADDGETHVDHFLITATRGLVGAVDPVVEWTLVPRAASAQFGFANGIGFVAGTTCTSVSGFPMVAGDVFRVVVRAVNGLGMTADAVSDGVVIDPTEPIVGQVFTGAQAVSNIHTPLGLNTGSLSVAWATIAEPESALVSVTVAVGTAPYLDDAIAATLVADPDGNARTGGLVTLPTTGLVDGQSYFATVVATNEAGVKGSRFARLVLDASPPVFAEVPTLEFRPSYSLPLGFNTQPTFPSAVSGASVSIPAFSFADGHSGLASWEVVVLASMTDPAIESGVASGELLPASAAGVGDVVLGPITLPAAPGAVSIPLSGAVVANGAFLWAVVTATNGVGLQVSAVSRTVSITTAQLTPGLVVDGNDPSTDLEYQPSTASYSARWAPFTDPDGGVVTYSVAVGTAPGLSDLLGWEDVGANTAVDVLQNFAVAPNTVVYATVRGTAAFRTATATSNGATLGALPPTVTNVRFQHDSPTAVNVVDTATGAHYVSATGPVVVSWLASDIQGLTTCVIKLTDAPESSSGSLMQATVPATDGVAFFDAALPQGQTLYATVECGNIRGRTAAASSNHWGIVETTPPTATGALTTTSAVPGAGGQLFLASTTTVTVEWSGVGDQESSVASLLLCLGTFSSPCSELSTPVAITSASYSTTSLGLADGTTYRWRLTATNRAGMTTSLESAPFVVDVSPPDGAASSVTLTLGVPPAVSWQGFTDAGSGITAFAVSLGTGPGLADVAGPVGVPVTGTRRLSELFAFDDVELSSGSVVFATVSATDSAGNAVTASSLAEIVDPSPPVPPPTAVRETVAATPGLDVDVQASTSIALEWDAFTDPESGIDHYEVMIVDVTDGVEGAATTLLAWHSVGTQTAFSSVSLQLQHGRTYVSTVRAFNGVGLVASLASDATSVDVTPPLAGTVEDGRTRAEGDVDLIGSLFDVSAFWSAFGDSESGIDHYEWCVGTSPGASDVVACHSVGLQLSATAAATGANPVVNVSALLAPAFGGRVAASVGVGGLTLDGHLSEDVLEALDPHLATLPVYFSTVTAVSEAGLATSAYSDGVSVDLLPPEPGTTIDSRQPSEPDKDISTSATSLHVAWLGFAEHQSSLAGFEVTIGSEPGLDDMSPVTWVEAERSAVTINDLQLANGGMYFATVTAVDAVGHRSSATSDGVLVDYTPPVFNFVLAHDPSLPEPPPVRAAASNSTVTFVWSASDDETPVASYEARLCKVLSMPDDPTPCAMEWTQLSTQRIELTAPSLAPGVDYELEVRAANLGGLVSTAFSPTVVVDDSGPTEGTVEVVSVEAAQQALAASGTLQRQLPIDVQSNWQAVAVQWSGFTDPESHIESYAVCIGSAPFTSDLARCQDVGLVQMAILDTSAASTFADAAVVASAGNMTVFFATVKATCGAGLVTASVSHAVQVDVSPPVAGSIVDGLAEHDVQYTTTGAQLCADVRSWYDAETDIARWHMCIGTQPGGCDVAAMQPTTAVPDPDTSEDGYTLCRGKLHLTHGSRVYTTVEAVNGAGLVTAASTNGVTVVLHDPQVGSVTDTVVGAVGTGTGVDTDLYVDNSLVAASWTEFGVGGVVPVVEYEVAVCRVHSGCDDDDMALSFFASVGLRHNISFGGQVLMDGVGYQFHVRAVDAAGRTSTAVSNGFIVDTSPPEAGSVAILSYGAANPGSQVLPPVDIPAAIRAAQADYGDDDSGNGLWHNGFAPMHLAWFGFNDPEAGVDEYRVSVGTSPSHATDIMPAVVFEAPTQYGVLLEDSFNETAVAAARSRAEAATQVLLTGHQNASATSSESVYVTVSACNTGGVCTPSLLGPVQIDMSPPQAFGLPVFLNTAGQPSSRTANLHAWHATWPAWRDPESHVARYTVGVLDVGTGEYVLPPTNVGLVTEVKSSQVLLTHGHQYVTELVGCVVAVALASNGRQCVFCVVKC